MKPKTKQKKLRITEADFILANRSAGHDSMGRYVFGEVGEDVLTEEKAFPPSVL